MKSQPMIPCLVASDRAAFLVDVTSDASKIGVVFKFSGGKIAFSSCACSTLLIAKGAL